ncbi:MAG TPA: peptide synthase, partial [Psychromonas hadalis]|nr:peptide synthase [Psychromonas hadalis]
HGLKSGDKAVLMVTPSLDFFSVTFGLFKAGIVPILVDPGMGIKNLKQCFLEAKPDAFIGIGKAHLARRLFGWGKQSLKHNITVEKWPILGGKTLASLLKKHPSPAQFEMITLPAKQMAAILFTSGSTGSPKGVVYTHQTFEAQIKLLKNDYQIKHGERDLATFPLFSLFGPALGMASIIPDMDASKPITANPNHFFAAIKKYQCTNLFANPALIQILGDSGLKQGIKLNSLQRVISAGAPADIESIKRFTKLLNKETQLLNSYGATESLPVSKIGSHQLLKTEEITASGGGICVGLPVQNTKIKIIAIADNIIKDFDEGLLLAENKVGEIIVQGDQVTAQYYHRDQATRDAKIQDGEQFYHRMGDLGYLDDHGQLWMCGRKKHRVEVSTNDNQLKTYFTLPCERIFNTHPNVKRSALVGSPINGQITAVLCIELQNKSTESPLKLFGELCFLADKNIHTKGIDTFLIHDAFPMDIRHNAKIFREKLAVWAEKELN